MDKEVVLSLRLGLSLINEVLFLGILYMTLFSEKLNIKEMFEIHWFLPVAAIACMAFCLFSAFSIYVVTEEGVKWMLSLGPLVSIPLRRKFTPWYYEILQVRGVFPFYYMFAFETQDTDKLSPDKLSYESSIAFIFCRNFLDLIIFVDENIACDKMDPKARERIRQLADKYRRLRSNHQVIYWILNSA
ncbi:MAG: hypothetical protein J6U20_06470 [Fibrobacter sp.]|nr:hypothetical protein [Fibrobacter sp.]